MEKRLMEMEKKIEALKKADGFLHNRIGELELRVTKYEEELSSTSIRQSPVLDSKIHHLTEVNEQMFQQNVRLREFIENCVTTHKVPTQAGYYDALKERN
ncbi:putative RNase H-like nuclease (RuvC/YqgF family) [Natronobacillus azotifigens]|uniref:Uncharacterized protein n=1 Tax=Natronobacillus azotifigens TaxID=472978 RepID=A0A9J6RF27_9BACI|nr:hypothetical protein [Natronobacillus azotifigens]MCZ0703777.1 hypothetical protein [Natronobacillus azotifigens]